MAFYALHLNYNGEH